MDTKQNESVLDERTVREIAETAARVAIAQYHKEAELAKQSAKDKRLHNTELLLKRYREFVAHSNSAIYEATQVEDDLDLDTLLEIMGCGSNPVTASVRSVQESVARTRLMIDHIDIMLDCFEKRCMKSKKPNDARMFRVIYGLYIGDEEKTIQELAYQENVEAITIYRDKKAAITKLSALIFGCLE